MERTTTAGPTGLDRSSHIRLIRCLLLRTSPCTTRTSRAARGSPTVEAGRWSPPTTTPRASTPRRARARPSWTSPRAGCSRSPAPSASSSCGDAAPTTWPAGAPARAAARPCFAAGIGAGPRPGPRREGRRPARDRRRPGPAPAEDAGALPRRGARAVRAAAGGGTRPRRAGSGGGAASCRRRAATGRGRVPCSRHPWRAADPGRPRRRPARRRLRPPHAAGPRPGRVGLPSRGGSTARRARRPRRAARRGDPALVGRRRHRGEPPPRDRASSPSARPSPRAATSGRRSSPGSTRGAGRQQALRGLRLEAPVTPGRARDGRREGRRPGHDRGSVPRLGPIALAYVHRDHFAAGTAVETGGRPATVVTSFDDAGARP